MIECSGTYIGPTYPGELALDKARRLCALKGFAQPDEAEAFFDWTRDVIEMRSAGGQILRELPLKRTIAAHEEELK